MARNVPNFRGRELAIRCRHANTICATEIGGERRSQILSGHLGADDFEINQESFFILDDFGLGRGDAEIAGQALSQATC